MSIQTVEPCRACAIGPHHMLQALAGLFSVGSSGLTRTAKSQSRGHALSPPVTVRTCRLDAHDLQASRLILPPSLIGCPFLEYDGANRALKDSRASVALLQRRGLPWQLASLATYALASQCL
jgi:hypothetical protein